MKILSIKKPEEALKFLEFELFFRQWRNANWKTKTGKLVPLKEMTDEHLKNTIVMLKRESEIRDILLENFIDVVD